MLLVITHLWFMEFIYYIHNIFIVTCPSYIMNSLCTVVKTLQNCQENVLSPTESIISKKGTKADIKLQVSVWQKATIWCVFYTLQNLRDKWEAVKKWFLTQNNNDPKNKLTKHIQQIYLSIYHLHSVTILSYIFF